MANTYKTHGIGIPLSNQFNTKYVIPYSTIPNLAQSVLDQSWFHNIEYAWNNPSELIISLKMYPFSIASYFGSGLFSSTIQIGSVHTQIPALSLPTNGVNPRLMGSFSIPSPHGNFLDYSPYTKIEMYLPFIGFVNLDPAVFIGESFQIYYSVDFDTGSVTASFQHSTKGVVMQCNGIIGFEIPMGASNASDNKKTMLSSALSVIGGAITLAVTDNPLPLAMSFVGAANNLAHMSEHISKGGAVAGKNALMSPFKIYYILTTMNSVGDGQDEYKSYKGIPLGESRRLGDLTGYTRCGKVHVENIPTALEMEKGLIEQILLTGVII